MILLCKTSRNTNRAAFGLLVFLLTAISSPAPAQFKSERDRGIVHDIIDTFGKECVQRESIDDDVVRQLDAQSKRVNKLSTISTTDVQIQKCYGNFYSQITGVFYLYQKICQDVSANPKKIPDSLAAEQLLEINKYQTGIRPFHSSLNDCLFAIPDKKGAEYIVPLSGLDLDVKVLERQIDRIQIKDPFITTFPVPAR